MFEWECPATVRPRQFLRVRVGMVGVPRMILGGSLLWDGVRVASVAVVVWLLLQAIRAVRRYVHFRRLELAIDGPPSLPVLGNVLAFLGVDETNAFRILLDLWGGRSRTLSRFAMFNRLFVFVTDPGEVERVVRDKRFHEKPSFMYGALSELLGEGLLTLAGRRWVQHRAVMMPTFHVAVLERFLPVFAEEADALVERIRPRLGAVVDVGHELRQAAARSAVRTSMASTLTAEDEPLLQRIIAGLNESLNAVNMRSFRPWLWPSFAYKMTALSRQQDAFNALTEAFVQRIIDKRTAELLRLRAEGAESADAQAYSPRGKSFIDLMLEAKLDGRVDFTDREIKDESKTLIAASLETSVTEMSFTFKMISIYPEVQARVHAELDSVFGDSDRHITPDDLPRLEYLERVIKETMRLFPSSSLVARGVREETELFGKVLPAGTTLIINIFGLQRDARHFPDPLRFDPDRFLAEAVDRRHPYAYLPFSAGPRSCIGQRYAMMQMKTVISTALRRHRVLPGPDGWTGPEQYPLNFEIVLRLTGGFHVRFEPR